MNMCKFTLILIVEYCYKTVIITCAKDIKYKTSHLFGTNMN